MTADRIRGNSFEIVSKTEEDSLFNRALTPKQIVAELDRYIVGQRAAKRAVAIALRNRWRRRKAPPELRDEIAPKNIIMIGPTGVGKTEIARRLSKLAASPFLKVEASKFTEVGYVGRDVESMVRDLVEIGIKMVQDEERERVRVQAEYMAEEKMLDSLMPANPADQEKIENELSSKIDFTGPGGLREKLRVLWRKGKLDDRMIEIETAVQSMPVAQIFGAGGMEEVGFNLSEMMSNIFPKKTAKRKLRARDAFELILQDEAGKLIDQEAAKARALERVQENGIIFIDEIDKIAGKGTGGSGPDISREGVQRDILPIVEGSTVATKYGMVKTDNVLFIAAGAFHMTKPSDLIPELQGRFPIRVNLDPLYKSDFIKILKDPENSLTRQYIALLATEKIEIEFTEDAIEEIAEMAQLVNESTENIGARRLHTIMEKVLEDLSFDAPDMESCKVTVDREYIRSRLKDLVVNEDLSRYIL